MAEELTLRLLLDQARVLLDLHGLLDEAGPALDAFAESVYEGLDHEWLYDESDGENTAFDVAEWFVPFNDVDRYVHPFAHISR